MLTFLERLKEDRPLLLDGGCGTLMLDRGGSAASGDNNLYHPEIVLALHREYLAAGAECLTANTFSLNGLYAARQRQSWPETEARIRAGMEIAIEAGAGKAYILADIGPSGEMLPPLGQAQPADFAEAYGRQAGIMAEYQPQAFLIETVFDLQEAELIVRACQAAAPEIPLLLSLTFASLRRGGATLMGHTAASVAAQAQALGCAAVGANCGDLTPQEHATVLASMREACGLPLLIQPNAGKPVTQAGRVSYPLMAEDFAQQMQACYDAGARLLGGCCGTTPAHIAALAQRFL